MEVAPRFTNCFPRSQFYPLHVQAAPRTIRETGARARSFPYSERHLQCVWADPNLRPPMMLAATGEAVSVENPGRWNLEAGPDFLDAVIVVGSERRKMCGDVEIHIRPLDWHSHGHANDAGYARVIAHVTYFPDTISALELPPGTIHIPLMDALRMSPDFSFESIDIMEYPYAVFSGDTAPCANALAEMSRDDHIDLLRCAGEERLRQKTERLAIRASEHGAEQILYEELMAALGYKNNSTACRMLAQRVPVGQLREESDGDQLQAYAILLGVSGLLPSKLSAVWDERTKQFVRNLWDRWWRCQSRWEHRSMNASCWKTSGLRPHNHPIRRLAAGAALFSRDTKLNDMLAGIDTQDPTKWTTAAAAVLRDHAVMEYWLNRLSLAGKPRDSTIALLGNNRIASILSNVVVPLLAAEGLSTAHMVDALPPEEENSLIRYTANLLFGRDHNPAIYRSGLLQQGLLGVFHDFCLNNRSGCCDCRFLAYIRQQ